MKSEFINNIIHGDCIEIMKEMPDNSIDLIFADPPYNLQLKNELHRPDQSKVNGTNDEWDKFDSFEQYDNFSKKWLNEAQRILKNTGTLWVIGSYHNIFRVGKIIQDLGFWILNDIIWVKSNPMPNFKGTRFTNAHETLIWAKKNEDSQYKFHYKGMKGFNGGKQMRSDWQIPICNGNERIKDENGEKAHSTQKPEDLLYRVILSSSDPQDIVLDPFMGSGTTGSVAKKLGRKFIGIEKEKNYIEVANKRIKAIEPLDLESLKYPIERKKPRVPFGNLISKGYISPGDYLYTKDLSEKARIQADASLFYKNEAGSIHQIGAKVKNTKGCNGWTFWYYNLKDTNKDEFILIDELRERYREEYIYE